MKYTKLHCYCTAPTLCGDHSYSHKLNINEGTLGSRNIFFRELLFLNFLHSLINLRSKIYNIICCLSFQIEKKT